MNEIDAQALATEWIAIPIREARVGDWYANSATITKIELIGTEIKISCDESISLRCRPDRVVVVGR